MRKSNLIIIIYIIGLIFGAVVLDLWSADTSPKALLGIGWTTLLLIGLCITEKNEKNSSL
jgi:L-asparagine transporter-like permease